METSVSKVLWSEGLFLRPHHFQQQTRYVESYINEVSQQSSAFCWGFKRLSLNTSLLEASGLLSVDHAHGTFPDGTPFQLGVTANAPNPLNLKEAKVNDHVYLCILPASTSNHVKEFDLPTGAERSVNSGTQYSRYLKQSVGVTDSTTQEGSQLSSGESATAVVDVGLLNTFLSYGSRLPDNVLALPLAKIEENNNGIVRLSASFIESVSDIKQSKVLITWLKELEVSVQRQLQQLSGLIGEVSFATPVTVNLLWLSALSRSRALFTGMLATGMHPTQAYRELLQGLGDLAPYSNQLQGSQSPFSTLEPYDHYFLTPCFASLRDLWFQILSAPIIQEATEQNLEYYAEGQSWVWKMSDKKLLDDSIFYFTARADVAVEELRFRLPNQATIGAVERFDVLKNSGSDIKLSALSYKPEALPSLRDWSYFEINCQGKQWQELADSIAMTFHVDGLHFLPNLAVKLWTVKKPLARS